MCQLLQLQLKARTRHCATVLNHHQLPQTQRYSTFLHAWQSAGRQTIALPSPSSLATMCLHFHDTSHAGLGRLKALTRTRLQVIRFHKVGRRVSVLSWSLEVDMSCESCSIAQHKYCLGVISTSSMRNLRQKDLPSSDPLPSLQNGEKRTFIAPNLQ